MAASRRNRLKVLETPRRGLRLNCGGGGLPQRTLGKAVARASTDAAPSLLDAVWGSSRAEGHLAAAAERAVVVHVQLSQARRSAWLRLSIICGIETKENTGISHREGNGARTCAHN